MIPALQQSDEYRNALDLSGVDARRSEAGLILHRRWPLMGTIGLLSRAPVPKAAHLRALRRDGLRLINAEDQRDEALRAAGFRQIITPAHVAELDLSGDLTSRMHPKWRNQWRKARNNPLHLRHSVWAGDPHWLLERELEQQRRRGYRSLPFPVLSGFARSNPRGALIVEARVEGAPVAAMLFLRHGRGATYQCGWTGDTGRALNAHRAVLMHGAAILADQGYLRLDLGPVDTQTNPGLARFKLGAGATARALGGTWLAIPGF